MRRPLVVPLVGAYLAAIVAANLITTHYGPTASIYTAFVLIGLDLTTRDLLHDFWGERRWPKLAALITAGSLLSYLINQDAGKIAVASCVAFAAAGVVDAVVYQLLHRREWSERVNVSNVCAAAVDSLLFPTIAFGGVLWSITFGQFVAKVAGGAIWALLLVYVRRWRVVPA